MLPRKDNLWDVKDLQTILKLYAKANHTYKRIGRKGRSADINHEKLAPEQYSIPQRSSMAYGINCRLVFD